MKSRGNSAYIEQRGKTQDWHSPPQQLDILADLLSASSPSALDHADSDQESDLGKKASVQRLLAALCFMK